MSEYIYLKNYKKPDFSIEKIDLIVEIYDFETIVSSTLFINKLNPDATELFLNGENLEIIELRKNDTLLDQSEYKLTNKGITLTEVKNHFTVQSKVKIFPEKNKTCEGLYQSGNILCTQNEPEGFRKFTYFIDRPDNLSIFTCKIIADKTKYPTLLANGNFIENGDAEKNRHYFLWHDPFKKPSYLFALVAGELSVNQDHFISKSGKKIDLFIYTDPGESDKSVFAMNSLKKSMKWDEDRFGLEYDLDRYMIVAVQSFNFGAMENKALNIFNAKYVLASSETATDDDFLGIENVIGHEYFHNYTGNRVTCRDWFQLTLKEGLTVFRDQEFSSDVFSRSMKRLQDIQTIKTVQFKEDNGPLSHPIRPDKYKEINNFYTSTVYNKGAEVIRMLYTIFGNEAFTKCIQEYLKRFDGKAVTTEDFLGIFEEINDVKLDSFKNWYNQSGTPRIKVETEYNSASKTYSLHLKQELKESDQAFYFPLNLALFSRSSGEKITEKQIIIENVNEKIEFTNIDEDLVPSLLRGFSAPVEIQYDYSYNELIQLFRSDDDFYNRFEASQKLFAHYIEQFNDESKQFMDTFKLILNDEKTDLYLKSTLLRTPSLENLFMHYDHFNIDQISENRDLFKTQVSENNESRFLDYYQELSIKNYAFDPESIAERKFKSLSLLYLSNNRDYDDLIYHNYLKVDNMTDRLSHIQALLKSKYRDDVINSFVKDFQKDPLTITHLFRIIASEDNIDLLSNLKKIETSSYFNKENPNHIRSLFTMISYNWKYFHDESGDLYEYYFKKIVQTDSFNPQIAAGLAKRLQIYKKLDSDRQTTMKELVENILRKQTISNDLDEIVTSIFE
jgi:aminopeptidase N